MHSIEDAEALRAAGIEVPIIMGPIELAALDRAGGLDLRMVAYNEETVERLIELEVDARLHIKIETGNHRQGISADEALRLADRLCSGHAGLKLEGICSHFANIEDTTDHRYARKQLSIFRMRWSDWRPTVIAFRFLPLQFCGDSIVARPAIGLGARWHLWLRPVAVKGRSQHLLRVGGPLAEASHALEDSNRPDQDRSCR